MLVFRHKVRPIPISEKRKYTSVQKYNRHEARKENEHTIQPHVHQASDSGTEPDIRRPCTKDIQPPNSINTKKTARKGSTILLHIYMVPSDESTQNIFQASVVSPTFFSSSLVLPSTAAFVFRDCNCHQSCSNSDRAYTCPHLQLTSPSPISIIA